ncbi:hypothetical protein VP01_914g1 [Puccinia sorghi]|uniref:SH3 domain-containing protein n=1 Tax=Puccinia sorghi TaxID=27349 RepID=A0A0L6U7H1_9BASI|nr:hypothetical protein VP01_914g1 [Puccinia sorghi]
MSSSWSSLSSVDKVDKHSTRFLMKSYFESRPHLFQQQTDAKTGDNFSALSSLAGSHPKITASALKSAGVPPSLAKPSHVSTASSASKHLNGIGSKVGQLSGKFSNHFANSENEPTPPSNPSAKPSSFNMNKFTGPSSEPSSSVFFWIIWTRSATPPISNQNSFAPPPTRRVAPSSAAPSYSQPPPPPARTKPQEDEELVEALYDYEGTSPEDLSFKEHQIIKVTEHSFSQMIGGTDRSIMALLECFHLLTSNLFDFHISTFYYLSLFFSSFLQTHYFSFIYHEY